MNTPRRRRLPRILLANVAVVLVSPIVLLHIVSFLFSSHDRNMKPLASRIVTDSSGHPALPRAETGRRRVGHPFQSPHGFDHGGLRRPIPPSFSAPHSCSTG